jgi:hypothetical protein
MCIACIVDVKTTFRSIHACIEVIDSQSNFGSSFLEVAPLAPSEVTPHYHLHFPFLSGGSRGLLQRPQNPRKKGGRSPLLATAAASAGGGGHARTSKAAGNGGAPRRAPFTRRRGVPGQRRWRSGRRRVALGVIVGAWRRAWRSGEARCGR